MIFQDRIDAGIRLAKHLQHYKNHKNTLILALPRGGVPVAYEVSRALSLPLDIFIVRKLGLPWHEELAMGAIASGGVTVFNEEVLRLSDITDSQIEMVKEKELAELERRKKKYRGDRPFPDLKDKTIILVDDGIATGATMRAAITALKKLDVKTLVVAIPVAPLDTCRELETLVDQFIVLETPEPFNAIGLWYKNFSQTSDDEVIALLNP